MKDLYKNIIKDFHLNGILEYKKRDYSVPINSGKIINIIGSRRAGKTYFFYQLIDEITKNTSLENIIYINFEDERISAEQKDLQFLLEAYFELYPNNSKNIYFFLDEIQYVEGWEKFVRRIYDTISKNIFITGSSSKLLNKEIAHSLRGRSITFEIFPLSFKEFLGFNNIDSDDIHSTKQKALIKNAFNNYIKEGGFPEVISAEDNIKSKIFGSYFDVMIYRDIIERYGVTNTSALKLFIKKCISNTSNKISINKLFNELKSQGIKISKDSLYQFSEYVQDCYLLFLINKYSESLSVQIAGEKKIYSIDNGLAKSVSFYFSEDNGRMLENLVFIELKRRGYDVFYYSNKHECDFVFAQKNKIEQAIQVTYKLHPGNIEREISGLYEAIDKFNLTKGLLLTEDTSQIEETKFKKIEIMTVWKWALTK